MKVSDYIYALQKLLDSEGDLEVLTSDPYRTLGAYRSAPKPEVAHKAILTGRERTNRFHLSIDSAEKKGEKVIRV